MTDAAAFSYLVRCVPTNQVYYGIRYKPGCSTKDLWSTYFTSSKRVHALIKVYGAEAFEYEIRRTFSTSQQAIVWEHKVLRRCQIFKNRDRWLNQNAGHKYSKSSDWGAKHSTTMKRKWQEPKYRATLVQSAKNRWEDPVYAASIVKHHAKTYVITFPDGREETITNLSQFARDHGLCGDTLNRVASPNWPHKSHKKFKARLVQ